MLDKQKQEGSKYEQHIYLATPMQAHQHQQAHHDLTSHIQKTAALCT
jgi:hypothetical protein